MFDKPLFSSIVGIIGLVVGIVSLYLYLRSTIRPVLECYKRGTILIDKDEVAEHELKIVLDGKEITKLNQTNIFIWNPTNKVIRRSDFAPKDQLRIVFDNQTTCYECIVAKQTNDICNSSVQLIKSEAIIDFDYLDHNDGFRIDILHDNTSETIRVNGTLIGSKGTFKKSYNRNPLSLYKFSKLITSKRASQFFILPIGLILIGLAIFLPESAFSNQIQVSDNNTEMRVMFGIMGLLYLMLIPLRRFAIGKQYPTKLDE